MEIFKSFVDTRNYREIKDL